MPSAALVDSAERLSPALVQRRLRTSPTCASDAPLRSRRWAPLSTALSQEMMLDAEWASANAAASLKAAAAEEALAVAADLQLALKKTAA